MEKSTGAGNTKPDFIYRLREYKTSRPLARIAPTPKRLNRLHQLGKKADNSRTKGEQITRQDIHQRIKFIVNISLLFASFYNVTYNMNTIYIHYTLILHIRQCIGSIQQLIKITRQAATMSIRAWYMLSVLIKHRQNQSWTYHCRLSRENCTYTKIRKKKARGMKRKKERRRDSITVVE